MEAVQKRRDEPEPEGSFRSRDLPQRLQELLAKVLRRHPGSQAFLADSDGLPLVDRGGGADLIATLSSLTHHWRKLRSSLAMDSGGEITVRLEQDKIVHLMQQETAWDDMILGVVANRHLDQNQIDEVRRWFSEAGTDME